MTKEYRSPVSNARFTSKRAFRGHCYQGLFELFEHQSKLTNRWHSWPYTYRFFRMLVRQAAWLAAEFEKQPDWKTLESFINANLDRIYAHPLSIYNNEQFDFKRVGRVEFLGGKFEDADGSYYFDGSDLDDDYKGRAYVQEVRLHLAPGGKRFKIIEFRDAMAAFGMYIQEEQYMPAGEHKNEHVDAHWHCKLVFIKKHWPLLTKPDQPEEEQEDEFRETDIDFFELDDDDLFDSDDHKEEDAREKEILESYKKITF